jgi:hypothetical protein
MKITGKKKARDHKHPNQRHVHILIAAWNIVYLMRAQ